jgi:uncharacterized protein (DUF2235 family)
MTKKIIVLSDGTGNSSAAFWRTNVWRMFESLDLSGSDRVALYDDGVGTSSFKPLAILGGAFGYGLRRNVIDIYKFICRNHRSPTDEIFGFGFSRGAFTIRVVMGLILDQGLVQATSEADLDSRAKAAYKSYRKRKFHTHWAELFHKLPATPVPPAVPPGNKEINSIRFLGLWDTVAAYGLPVEEMTRGVNKWIWPLELPNRVLSDKVKRACHALSLDDERKTFHPVLWDESAQQSPPNADQPRPLNSERISQVWFSGVHSNVGGGYPDDSLAHIPLSWIMSEAQQCGLKFKAPPKADPDALVGTMGSQDKDGRLYNSRAGFASSYRYGPRKLAELCDQKFSNKAGDSVKIAMPKIHESVFRRIKNNAHPCAPLGIPEKYEIVTDAGQILPLTNPPTLPQVLPQAHNQYEMPASARAREVAQERIWDLVWLRKIVYAVTALVGIFLFIFPLLRSTPPSHEFESPVRWISDLIRLVGSVLPSIAQPWLDGYARNPITFAVIVLLFAALMMVGGRLASRIKSDMGRLWQDSTQGSLLNPGPPTSWIYRLRTSKIYRAAHAHWRLHLAPGLTVVVLLYLGLTLASHIAFNVFDVAGYVCKDAASRATPLAKGEKRTVEFNTLAICTPTGIMLEEGKRYLIVVKAREPRWYDANIETSPAGFHSWQAPGWQKLFMVAALPLRRELIRPWFRVVARMGGVGGEESFLDPDPKDQSIEEVLKATRDGELFLFVNDAVLGIPGLYDVFYRNNVGIADVTVTRR